MAALDALPPLREVIERHSLMAKKSLGQNFLLDLNLTSRVARASGPLEGASVIEVGPGPGGLTRALLAGGVAELVVIERDARCIPALEEIAAHYPGRMTIVAGDALKIDGRTLIKGENPRIVANLPYNVGTQLLINWLRAEPWPPWFASLTLMFQKEVAQRIVAAPGSGAYGRLGILCGWRAEARIMFDIAPSAFVPPPKITSSVVHLVPRPAPLPCSLTMLERVTEAAFGQRRKMLRQSLKGLPHYSEDLLARAGIRPEARPETLDIAQFCALARAFSAS